MISDDLELIRRARSADDAAREQLFERHADYVIRTLYGFAKTLNRNKDGKPILNEEEFRGAVQDLSRTAFAEAFAAIAAYDPAKGASFPTWVVWKGRARLRQVVGRAVKARIERDLQVTLESIESLPAEIRETYLPDAWHANPETIYLAKERQVEHRAKIEAVLRAMPAEQARALVTVHIALADAGRARIKDAARATGRTVEAMDSLLRRAEKRFRQEWESRFGAFE